MKRSGGTPLLSNEPVTFKQKGAILLAHTAAAKKQSEPKMSRALVRQETIAGYLFLLPSLIFFIGLSSIPW